MPSPERFRLAEMHESQAASSRWPAQDGLGASSSSVAPASRKGWWLAIIELAVAIAAW